jgi:hypothetical protein
VVTRKGIEREGGKPRSAYGQVLTTATETGGCYCESNFEAIIKKLRPLALKQRVGTKVIVVHGVLSRSTKLLYTVHKHCVFLEIILCPVHCAVPFLSNFQQCGPLLPVRDDCRQWVAIVETGQNGHKHCTPNHGSCLLPGHCGSLCKKVPSLMHIPAGINPCHLLLHPRSKPRLLATVDLLHPPDPGILTRTLAFSGVQTCASQSGELQTTAPQCVLCRRTCSASGPP